MRLKILLPTGILLDEEAHKINAEAQNGSFCLLPRHIDFVAALAPGLLSFETAEAEEIFIAVDEGILVKSADEVFVSVRNAVRGPDLGTLRQTVEQQFMVVDDRERKARSASAKIEVSFVRRFLELQEHG